MFLLNMDRSQCLNVFVLMIDSISKLLGKSIIVTPKIVFLAMLFSYLYNTAFGPC
jgi:hypothetical protein